MSNIEAFKRGQVVWALWRVFSRRRDRVPAAFATRVRKLGELGVPLSAKERPGQAGIDIDYMVEHAFELGVALKCLDIGLKQSEVAFFMQHIRDDLREVYRTIMASPPSPGQRIFAKDRPNSPACMVVAGGNPRRLGDTTRCNISDNSVYMTFRSVEIREAWDASQSKKKEPFIFVPKFHQGLEAVTEEIERLAHYIEDHSRIVIELSNFAVLLTDALQEAPQMRRGRQ
jgi:hypothetical protein